jgi:hypothetical protein
VLWLSAFVVVVTAWGLVEGSRDGSPRSALIQRTGLGWLLPLGLFPTTLRGRVTGEGVLFNGHYTPWSRVVALDLHPSRPKTLLAMLQHGGRQRPGAWEFAEGDDALVLAAWEAQRVRNG